mgnify:CR=1 FL=1
MKQLNTLATDLKATTSTENTSSSPSTAWKKNDESIDEKEKKSEQTFEDVMAGCKGLLAYIKDREQLHK